MKPSYKLAFTILFALAMLFSGTNAETSLRKSQLISDSFSYSVSTHEVKDVFFLNATNGWMAVTDHTTDTGYLLATQDAGRTWRWFSTPPQIGRVFFTSPHHGWALRFVSDSSSAQTTIYLLSTKDGGEHWTSESDKPVVAVPTSKNGRITASMAFLNESHAWFVGRGSGASGYVLETTDGQSFKTPSGLPPGLIGC